MDPREQTTEWFTHLRDLICAEFEALDGEGTFIQKPWQRDGGGGGVMSIMKGKIFEKVGVNISKVYGEFDAKFRKEIPGAEEDPSFFATGISLVAHMRSPLVPAVHMNTRYIETSKSWFGGGADLNPMIEDPEDTANFHQALQTACDQHDSEYYSRFKKWADEYFYIKHRNEARGVGGIFYDHLNTGNFAADFAFTQDVGKAFLTIYPQLIIAHKDKLWTTEQREIQLRKRGRYTEFNLIYDRGTRFGLMTGGNIEAILMSLPPEAKWD